MHQHYLVHPIPPSTVCRCRLWDVRPYVSSLVFLFSALFVEVLPSSTSKIVPNITRETAKVSIPFMRYLLYDLVSSSFLVLMRKQFKFFLSSPLVWWCPLPTFPSICKFLILSWFGSSISSVMYCFALLIICIAHFSMPNSITMSWL